MRPRSLLVTTLVLYAGTWVANRSLRRVEGGSMRPTLEPGDLVVVVPPVIAPLRPGVIVVVPDPRDGRRTVKRVAALAGEAVDTDVGRIHAGARQVVVLGDDPTASTDSRHYGPVPAGSVEAVAVAALRPWRWLGRVRPAPPPTGTR